MSKPVLCTVAATALLLSACGTSSDAATTTASTRSATAASTRSTTTATAAASGSVKIAKGKISIPKRNVGSVDLTRLPLGTDKVSSSPRKGYIYSCRSQAMEGGDDVATPSWIHGRTWNLKQKITVSGSVTWSQARFSNVITDNTRVLSGNDLPLNRQPTGVFPVQAGTPAASFRPNPSTISAHDFTLRLPAQPTVNAQASCMGGEVGVTLDGVELFNGFDAANRDAGAEEVLDKCDGHPNMFGYHHHTIPWCLSDPGTGQSRLLGYALDGFGIYGHRGAGGKVLTNKDLDACHGITSTVTWNGRKVRMYHYVATWEFPYTVGCFRGTPAVRGPAFG